MYDAPKISNFAKPIFVTTAWKSSIDMLLLYISQMSIRRHEIIGFAVKLPFLS